MSERTITFAIIYSPIDKVWNYISDKDRLAYWLTGFKSLEHISGIKGEKGCISKMVFVENGKKVEVIEEILNVVEKKEFYFKIENDDFTSYSNFHLKSLMAIQKSHRLLSLNRKNLL